MNSIRAFEAASRHLSFQDAAVELGVTPSALSYQIRQLEETLDLPLFVRQHRKVALTKYGAMAAPLVGEGFEKLVAAFSRLKEKDANKLVVTTGPAFSAKWLAPRLYSFVELYPEVDLRLQASLKLSDFQQDEIDVAIRFGGGDYPGLYVESLFDEAMVPLISPTLFESLGGEANERLLQSVRLLHDDSINFAPSAVSWDDWIGHMGYKGIDTARGSRFNHADHGIEAAIDGAGIVLGRLDLAFRDLKAGRLIAPYELALSTTAGFYLCMLEESLNDEGIMRFVAWLRDEAHEQTEEMAGFLKGKRVV